MEDEPGGLGASHENVLVVIHARSLPEDVGMEEAAPHPARANPLESLAVPVAVRDDVAHLGGNATPGLLPTTAEPLPIAAHASALETG